MLGITIFDDEIRAWPRLQRFIRQLFYPLLHPNDPKPTCLVIREGLRVVQGAGMDPHALGSHLPGAGDGSCEKAATDTLADEPWQKAEVGELHSGVVLMFEFEITAGIPDT